VLDQFPETLGGGERVILKLARLLPLYGYKASILTFAIHPRSNLPSDRDFPIYLLPLQRTYDLNAIRASFIFKKFIRQQKIEIVQTFFESSDLWAGFVTKIMTNAKLVWSRRDMGILRTNKHHLAYRLLSNFPDAVFAVSDQVRQQCIDVDRVEPQRVYTIYNGLDILSWPEPSRSATSAGLVSIVSVGNIRRVKGHDIFIRAAAQVLLRFDHVKFSIAGAILEPDYFIELQQLVESLGLKNKFHFLGGTVDLREYLAEATIFVLPSRSEGFSNAIIEAMAASLPVVATTVGGNAEAVVDGVSGYLVPPDDAGALALAIEKLLSNPSKAASMGASGRSLVIQKFTVDAMMKSMTDWYRSMRSAD
jgi:glycosyltransferase involved in cell wall biosynthesis